MADLLVLWGHLAHQHVQVLRVPLPVLTAEILQQADGLMQAVEDAHHPKNKRGGSKVMTSSRFISSGSCGAALTAAFAPTVSGRGRR